VPVDQEFTSLVQDADIQQYQQSLRHTPEETTMRLSLRSEAPRLFASNFGVAAIHGAGMQVDATVKLVLFGVESPEVSSSLDSAFSHSQPTTVVG
jgi:hypothetical protein